MIVEVVKVDGRVVGEIQKPSQSRAHDWTGYVKGTMGFRAYFTLIGTWKNKRDAIRAVKQWRNA